MKNFLSKILIISSFFASGQTIVTTKITPEHQEIYGSKISMIAPKSFTVAKNFMGFQELETNSSIMVLDIPGPFSKIIGGLTKENLQKQGVEVEVIENIIINEMPGVLIKGKQTAYEIEFRKYILVFGSETETIMINGIVPHDNQDLEQEIKTSLWSTFYDSGKTLTPLDAVDFKVSPEGTDFIFAKNMSNMLIYNRDGKMPTESLDKASMVIAKSFSKLEITDKKEFSINRIKGLPMQISKIINVSAIEINGLNGFEITADGTDRKTGEKERAYQVILFNNSDYYILYGSSSQNFESNTLLFKQLARTFRLK